MSQLTRTFATAASSFASKRSYAQSIRLPAAALPAPNAIGTYSNPGSPNSALFAIYGTQPRATSQSQVPFAVNPHLPAGISPASQPPMNLWATSPPLSPSQLHFRIQQTPPSPSQLQFGAQVTNLAPQSQSLIDYGFMLPADSVSPAFNGSPATSSRSMSPAPFDPNQAAYTSVATFQPLAAPLTAPRKTTKREDCKEGKKGLNPFTYYRSTFPVRYPFIDKAIPSQKERSRITGAFWQHESPAVRQACEAAVFVNRTPAQAERLEKIRLQTQEKRRQERIKAGTNNLEGRNALIFRLWQNNVTEAEFNATVADYDQENPLPEPARKRRRKVPVRKLDAELMLAAETFSVASSSPQPSNSSLAHSPAAQFNPELPTAVIHKQDSWVSLAGAMPELSYDLTQPEVISVEQAAPVALTYTSPSPASECLYLTPDAVHVPLHGTTLYDGMTVDYAAAQYALGSEAEMNALLGTYQQPYSQDVYNTTTNDMENDFTFIPGALPTEEDGLSFDAAFFGHH